MLLNLGSVLLCLASSLVPPFALLPKALSTRDDSQDVSTHTLESTSSCYDDATFWQSLDESLPSFFIFSCSDSRSELQLWRGDRSAIWIQYGRADLISKWEKMRMSVWKWLTIRASERRWRRESRRRGGGSGSGRVGG